MKRNVSDVIRRGFDSTLANWQVVMIRIVESVAIGVLVIISLVAVAVPIVVSAGISKWTVPSGNTPFDAMMSFLADHLLLIAYLLSLTIIVAGVAIAVHAFISAGAARTYVDAERKTAANPAATRDALAAFSYERFFAEARSSWWRIFWIYNATWSVAALILLIPIVITAVLLVPAIASNSAGGIVAVSCGGLALIALVAIPVGFIVALWTQKAIIVCVAADAAVRDALRTAWRAVRADFARHAVVGIVIMVISMGAGMLISGMLAPLALLSHDTGMYATIFAPPRLMISVMQSAISNGISCWFIASFAAMTEEG